MTYDLKRILDGLVNPRIRIVWNFAFVLNGAFWVWLLLISEAVVAVGVGFSLINGALILSYPLVEANRS